MCRAFGFPVKVRAAGVAFLQRFYLARSPLRHDPKDILLAAIYLAGKVGCLGSHPAAASSGPSMPPSSTSCSLTFSMSDRSAPSTRTVPLRPCLEMHR